MKMKPEAIVKLLAKKRQAVPYLILAFSIPPSANKAWRNTEGGKGRVRSNEYKNWVSKCCTELADVRIGKVEGPYSVIIEARRPDCRGGALRDIDNLIKPTLDVLAKTGITPDDRHCMEVTARWTERRGEGIDIRIRALAMQKAEAA